MKRTDLIAKEYRDSDGYWIYLKPGWQNGADPGTHGIVENTKRAARGQLAYAKPCDCEDCKRYIKEGSSR
jgi:hypothetical protein